MPKRVIFVTASAVGRLNKLDLNLVSTMNVTRIPHPLVDWLVVVNDSIGLGVTVGVESWDFVIVNDNVTTSA